MRRNFVALAAYLGLSFFYLGLPVAGHPGGDLIGYDVDPEIFAWSLAWWPHAILHWENPIVSHAIYAPGGIDLAWTATVPGLAIAFAPVTLLFGPDVSFNVAELLMPALSAFTAYLLCRRLTGSLWASAAG